MELMEHQKKAVDQLENGKILWGGVGSGKSATVLAYYMEHERPRDIYVITTAKKRDSLDWVHEAAKFGLSQDLFLSEEEYKNHWGILTVDSWNNIGNYLEVKDGFFIFDEQRLVGNGTWVKSFLKIAKNNHWVLLSATPGDNWMDYVPVFIANGYYKNVTEFKRKHVIYEPFNKYPKISGYLNELKLELLRNEVLVEMPYLKHTERIINKLEVGYNRELSDVVRKKRWNPFDEKPIVDAGEAFRLTKKIVYSDPSRLEMVRKLLRCHDRVIIYYSYNFELEILRTLSDEVPVYEWNGHRKHHNSTFENNPRWVYLVQYVSGAEAWNCTKTNAMILYSLTYSYKNYEQSLGRIDRLDSEYKHLYYYILYSDVWLDKGVLKALESKKNFNEKTYLREENVRNAPKVD